MSQIQCFPSGPFETNAYLLSCLETNQGIFIDPAPGSREPLIQAAGAVTIEAILLTHSHWDHIGDLKVLKETFSVPVYVHPADRPNVVKPGSDGLPLMIPIEGVEPEFHLKEGQRIPVGHLELQVIETPGHTPGGVSFFLEKEKILFSGDTLFKGSIGNLSLPTANRPDMWRSLEKLEKLPPETVVYSGHGPATILREEKWLSQAREIFN